MAPIPTRRSPSQRAQRALARAAGDRRLVAGTAVTAGAALAAGVARELLARTDGDDVGGGASRAYRIKRKEELTKAIVRIARGRVDDALEHLSEGLDRDVSSAVHEARKDLKKARAVVRLVRVPIGKSAYRRENARLHDAARALSGSRDAEVKIETLEAIAERAEEDLPEGFTAMRANLEKERDGWVAEHDDGDSDLRRAAELAAAEIAAARDSISRWQFASSGWALLEPGLKRSYRRGRKRFHETLADPSAENVHEWRKRVKDLWYHLRLLRDSWPETLSGMSDQAHELSDLLGDHHDLTVLGQDAQMRPELAGDAAGLSAAKSLITDRQRELMEAAVPIGERCYAESPKAFAKRLRTYWQAWRPD
jgi:CHAD domain-containing protein